MFKCTRSETMTIEASRRNRYHIGQHQYLGRYICREWNARHTDGEQITDLEIVYMQEWTLPDNAYSVPEKKVLWEHNCS